MRIVAIALLLSISFHLTAQSENIFPQWVAPIESSGPDQVAESAYQPNGFSLSAGSFEGLVDFDPGVSAQTYLAVGRDGFLLSLDTLGQFDWVRVFTCTGAMSITGLDQDNSGNIYLTGYFSGTVDLDPGPGNTSNTSKGDIDLFLAKYSPGGLLIWSKTFGTIGKDASNALAIIDTSIFIAGKSGGLIEFDPVNKISIPGGAFVVSYGSSGGYLDGFSLTANISHYGLAMGNSDTLYVTGYADAGQSVDFDPTAGKVIVPTGNGLVYAAAYSASGTYIWHAAISATDPGQPLDIGSDSHKNLYIPGWFAGTVDFDPGLGTASRTAWSGEDGFLWKLSSTGNYQWVRQWSAKENALTLAAQSWQDSIVLVGGFIGDSTLLESSGSNRSLFAQGEDGLTVGYLTGDGSILFAQQLETADTSRTIGLSTGNTTYDITGQYQGQTDFHPGQDTLIYDGGPMARGFIARYCIRPSKPNAINGTVQVCQGTSETYSVIPAPAGIDYQWTVPTGASISAGQGQSTVTIQFGSNAQSGYISVAAINDCAASDTLSIPITTSPGIGNTNGILGPDTVCAGQSGVSFNTFSVNNANSYTWLLPPGATITAGQNTRNIAVQFASGATSGLLQVFATNGCGNSDTSSQLVTVLPLPVNLGVIQGPDTLCPGSTYSFTVNPVTGATNYQWTVPAGHSITSGQGTNSIMITPGNQAVSGIISVMAGNNCGTTSPVTKIVQVPVAPAQPGTILGPDTICQGESIGYRINPVTGASTYEWTLPAQMTLTSGQGTIAIAADIDPAFSGTLTIEVQSGNGCSFSTPASKSLVVLTKPSTPSISQIGTDSLNAGVAADSFQWFFMDTLISGNHQILIAADEGIYKVVAYLNGCASDTSQPYTFIRPGIGNTLGELSWKVYPNPARDFFQIEQRATSQSELFAVEVIGTNGQLIFRLDRATSNQIIIPTTNWPDGLYLIQIRNNYGRSTKLVEIQH